MSADQLEEKTDGNFDEGVRVTTYGDLKKYRQTETDLGNQIAILSQSGTGVGFDALDAAHANGSDIAALNVSNLLGNLQDNKPGALKAAQAYPSAVQGSGQFPGDSSPQGAFDTYHAEIAYRQANRHGNWSASDTASVALSVLTQKDTADEPAQNAGPVLSQSKV